MVVAVNGANSGSAWSPLAQPARVGVRVVMAVRDVAQG